MFKMWFTPVMWDAAHNTQTISTEQSIISIVPKLMPMQVNPLNSLTFFLLNITVFPIFMISQVVGIYYPNSRRLNLLVCKK